MIIQDAKNVRLSECFTVKLLQCSALKKSHHSLVEKHERPSLVVINQQSESIERALTFDIEWLVKVLQADYQETGDPIAEWSGYMQVLTVTIIYVTPLSEFTTTYVWINYVEIYLICIKISCIFLAGFPPS